MNRYNHSLGPHRGCGVCAHTVPHQAWRAMLGNPDLSLCLGPRPSQHHGVLLWGLEGGGPRPLSISRPESVEGPWPAGGKTSWGAWWWGCRQGGSWLQGWPAAPRNLSAMQSGPWPVFIYAERVFISAPFSLIGQEMAGIVTYLAAQGVPLSQDTQGPGGPAMIVRGPFLSPRPFVDPDPPHPNPCTETPSRSLS